MLQYAFQSSIRLTESNMPHSESTETETGFYYTHNRIILWNNRWSCTAQTTGATAISKDNYCTRKLLAAPYHPKITICIMPPPPSPRSQPPSLSPLGTLAENQARGLVYEVVTGSHGGSPRPFWSLWWSGPQGCVTLGLLYYRVWYEASFVSGILP